MNGSTQEEPLVVGDVIDLAFAKLESGEERLEHLYGWRHERGLAKAREAFAAGGLILTPLLAAVFDRKAHVEGWTASAYLLGAGAAFGGGLVWLARLREVDREYLDVLRLYGLLRRAILGP